VIDDLVIIGAGAAGLATAIFAARRAPGLRIRCLDGARHLGAKILVSGGSRCNVTNRVVSERDFWGGSSRVVRGVLRAFPAERAALFFRELGVALHDEADGKLFPDTHRSRTVLDALLNEVSQRGVVVDSGRRVTTLARGEGGFAIGLAGGATHHAAAVVLATGGRSLPKTGSDGWGYQLAQSLGHSVVPTTPALAPLLLEGDLHAGLSGVAHRAAAVLHTGGTPRIRLQGDWLWTHFGASGPLALNLSRHWHRADLQGQAADVLLSVCAGERFETVESWLIEQAQERPRARALTVLTSRLPAAVAARWLQTSAIPDTAVLAQLRREDRRRLVHALVSMPLRVVGSRGYQYAEVTAGGVPLEEIDPATLESRCCPGLYFAGEILDVDGRLGGFNFQWAWSSGYVAGTGAADRLSRRVSTTRCE
jgi:predicted Rossmann fold flavoprotein